MFPPRWPSLIKVCLIRALIEVSNGKSHALTTLIAPAISSEIKSHYCFTHLRDCSVTWHGLTMTRHPINRFAVIVSWTSAIISMKIQFYLLCVHKKFHRYYKKKPWRNYFVFHNIIFFLKLLKWLFAQKKKKKIIIYSSWCHLKWKSLPLLQRTQNETFWRMFMQLFYIQWKHSMTMSCQAP